MALQAYKLCLISSDAHNVPGVFRLVSLWFQVSDPFWFGVSDWIPTVVPREWFDAFCGSK